MVISIMATVSNWTDAVWPLGMLLPPVSFDMLVYGVWLRLGYRPHVGIWQYALIEVKFLVLLNLVLSPFFHLYPRALS